MYGTTEGAGVAYSVGTTGGTGVADFVGFLGGGGPVIGGALKSGPGLGMSCYFLFLGVGIFLGASFAALAASDLTFVRDTSLHRAITSSLRSL